MNSIIKPKRTIPSRIRALATASIALTLVSQVSACGRRHFEVSSSTSAQKAPGTYTIPPQIDILLAQDNSGSIYESYADIAREMPELLSALEAKG